MKVLPETAELIVPKEAPSGKHTIVQSDVF
jgi:hypothetical protein